MSGLKLVFTAVLVAVNAFFVIAEYALVRSRRARLEVLRDGKARGRGVGAGSAGEHQRVHLGGADRRDDDLDRHRRAGRHRARGSVQGSVWKHISPWRGRRDLRGGGLRDHRHHAADRGGDGAEVLRHQPRRDRRPPYGPPAAGLQRALSPAHRRAHRRLGLDPAWAGRRHERSAGWRLPGGAQAPDRGVLRRAGISTRARRGCSAACFTCTSRRPAR